MDEDAISGLVLISGKGLVEGCSIETQQSQTNSAPVKLQEGQIARGSQNMEKQRMLMMGLRSPELIFTHRYQKKLANENTISKPICSRLEVVNGGGQRCWWH